MRTAVLDKQEQAIHKSANFNHWKQLKTQELSAKLLKSKQMEDLKAKEEKKKLKERKLKAKSAWEQWKNEKIRQNLLNLAKKSFADYQLELAYAAMKMKREKAHKEWLRDGEGMKLHLAVHSEPWHSD